MGIANHKTLGDAAILLLTAVGSTSFHLRPDLMQSSLPNLL